DRIMMVAAEQPAGLDHCIGDRAAYLVEHQPLDRAELCTVAPVDGGVLDAIAGNQAMVHGLLPRLFACSGPDHSTNEPRMRGHRAAPRSFAGPHAAPWASAAVPRDDAYWSLGRNCTGAGGRALARRDAGGVSGLRVRAGGGAAAGGWPSAW